MDQDWEAIARLYEQKWSGVVIELNEKQDRLLALEADIQRLDDVLNAGGICDLSFHTGQVRAMKERIIALEDGAGPAYKREKKLRIAAEARLTDLEAALRALDAEIRDKVSRGTLDENMGETLRNRIKPLLHPETAAAPEGK